MIGNIVGNYKILEKVGEGGMGAVYRGIDLMLEREVAIKALRPELAREPNIVERFRTEAITLARLNHPHIATLYSFLRQGDSFFMAMEFVRGETLDRRTGRIGALSEELALPLFCQALDGIEHAHGLGIIHRDIKPANIMVTLTGSIKVMDFGIARVLGSARMTKQGNIIGTLEYMSPEQVRGQETDARSDIYSLGILLYEMLTGRVPFRSDSEFNLMKSQIEDAPPTPSGFIRGITGEVEVALMRALAKDPAVRFQSVAEFRHALSGDRTGKPAHPVAAVSSLPIPPLASSAAGPGFSATRASAAGPSASRIEIKETRLAAGGGYSEDFDNSQIRPSRPPALSPHRLNRSQLTAAVIAMVSVLGIALVMLLMLRNPPKATESQPAAVSEPVVKKPPPEANQESPPAAAGSQSQPIQQQTPALNELDRKNKLEGIQPTAKDGARSMTPARSRSMDAAAEAKEKERRRKAAESALDKP